MWKGFQKQELLCDYNIISLFMNSNSKSKKDSLETGKNRNIDQLDASFSELLALFSVLFSLSFPPRFTTVVLF